MTTPIKLFLLTIWGCMFLPESVNSQRHMYKHKDVNQYEIRNGKYRLIPTTTRPPSLMETFFPWTGNAYNSVRTPEEDAAILNSLSDPVSASSNAATSSSNDNDGYMSWLSMPSMPSIPGFGSSTSATGSNAPPPSVHPAMNRPMHGPMNAPMNFHNINNIPMHGSPSQNEPVVVPPPGAENQFAASAPLQVSPMELPPPSLPTHYPESPENYDIPQEIHNNLNPTFQFHQQVKDSIPIPSPTIQGLGQSMFPYPAGGNIDFGMSTTERSSSFLDTISSYLTFGKRSDLEGQLTIQDEDVMQPRIMRSDEEYETEEDDNEAELKEEPSDDSEPISDPSETSPSADSKPYACPNAGIWRWNGEVCIAVGPVPIWACKPNDLVTSGKIAICRNKVFFSPTPPEDTARGK